MDVDFTNYIAKVLTETDYNRASLALQYATNKLVEVGKAAGRATQKQAHRFMQTQFDQLLQQLTERITTHGSGSTHGHTQRALANAETYLRRAIVEKYRVDQLEVRNALAFFLLTMETEGFRDEDVTGTQVGSTQSTFGGFGENNMTNVVSKLNKKH